MNDTWKLILLNLLPVVLVLSAVALALNDVSGWGWLILVALITSENITDMIF